MTTMASGSCIMKCSSCRSMTVSIELQLKTRSEDQDAKGQLEQPAVVWAASAQPASPLYTQGGRECERGLCRKPRQLTNPGVGTASETDVHGLIDANLQSPLVYARVPPRMHNQ